MPLLIACPNTQCNHPGPLGFSEPRPWGWHVYHDPTCPGAWEYSGRWYNTEQEAWKAFKKSARGLDPLWVKAYDAKILRNSNRSYKYWIGKWHEQFT